MYLQYLQHLVACSDSDLALASLAAELQRRTFHWPCVLMHQSLSAFDLKQRNGEANVARRRSQCVDGFALVWHDEAW